MCVRLFAVILALVVAACGDGGSGDHAAAPTPTATASPRAGTLDAGFGDAGVVTTDFAGRSDLVNAMAIQPDGRIVVAGQSLPPDGRGGFAVARYLPDGTLDPSFGDGGRVLTPPSAGSFASATAVALDAAGRILLAGSSIASPTSSWQVVRYTARGDVDTSFGAGGVVELPDTSGSAVSLVVEPSGALLVAGTRFRQHAEIAVERVLEDGRLDDAFGAGGIAVVAVGQSTFSVLVARADGTILVGGVGTVVVDGLARFAFLLARLRPDGALDPTFGDGGTVVTVTVAGPEFPVLLTLAVGGDGGIVAAGYPLPLVSHVRVSGMLLLARYDANGVPDPTFGDGGVLRTEVAVAGGAVAVFEPSGAMLIGDRTLPGDPFTAARVRRVDANGVLDSTFGDGGAFVGHLRPDDESAFQALALQPDGGLLAAGFSRLTLGDYDFALARLWR